MPLGVAAMPLGNARVPLAVVAPGLPAAAAGDPESLELLGGMPDGAAPDEACRDPGSPGAAAPA
ncbi:MAG TPA: hypothetical protein VH684_06325 [Xanthobacteraceae bacterium]